jgi:molybdopterin-guanine dinucleotide biosynthesis protein A
VLFLSCDMPFVSLELLKKIVVALPARGLGAFIFHQGQGSSGNSGAGDCGNHSASAPKPPEARTSEESRGRAPRAAGRAGFPFVLRREALVPIEGLLVESRFALQDLAAVLNAKFIRVPKPFECQLFNINTPADWKRAREFWKESHGRAGAD